MCVSSILYFLFAIMHGNNGFDCLDICLKFATLRVQRQVRFRRKGFAWLKFMVQFPCISDKGWLCFLPILISRLVVNIYIYVWAKIFVCI